MSFSSNNHLRLVQLEPTTFAGINNTEDQSLVITFPEYAKYAMILEGDQATGKTSLLDCLKFMFTGDEPANAINSITNDKKVKAVFSEKDGDIMYYIKTTRTGYSIEKHEKVNGTIEKSAVKEPKSWLRNKIGNVGVDPSFLKRMSAEDQISWVRDLVKLDPEKKKEEQEIRNDVKKYYKERTAINRDLKSKKQQLISSGYFSISNLNKKDIVAKETYAADMAKYAEPIEEKQKLVSETFKLANENKNKFDALVRDKNNYVGQKQSAENKVEQLKKDLAFAEENLASIISAEKQNQLDIEKYASAVNDFLVAQKEVEGMSLYVAGKTSFEAIQKTSKDYEVLKEESGSHSIAINSSENRLQQFILSITPDIPGLELCVSQDIDVADELTAWKDENEGATPEAIAAKETELKLKNRSGIYYKGHAISELCESEIWGFCTQAWRIQSVPVIFVENISSLGSDALATLNQFIESGGQVYATRMNRELKNMKISFETEIK